MYKFNIGDKVKILRATPEDGEDNAGFVPGMDEYVGDVGIVSERGQGGYQGQWYRIEGKGNGWAYDERCFRRLRKAVVKEEAVPIEAAIIAPVRPEGVFLKGDVVICVDNSNYQKLKLGGEYVISQQKGGIYVNIGGFGLMDFYCTRFKLKDAVVKEEKEEKKEDIKKPSPISTFMAHLQEEVEKAGDAGTCSYGKLYADGTHKLQRQDACHARIPSYEVDQDIICLALNIKGHEKQMGARLSKYHKYVEYILGQSPWASCFHYKGLSHALKHGVGMDVEQKMEHLIGAAIALREGSEYCSELDVFDHLSNLGYSGNVCYLMSRSFNMKGEAFTYRSISNGHKVLHPQHNAEKLFEFFRNGPLKKKEDKPYRTTHKAYHTLYVHTSPLSVKKEGQIAEVLRTLVGVKEVFGFGESPIVSSKKFIECADFLSTVLDKE